MEVKGKVYQILPAVTGTGANGNWIKQSIVIETTDQYPKKVCVTAWGKACDNLDTLSVGQPITAHVNLESREYGGKWYSEIKGWKFTHALSHLAHNESANINDNPDDADNTLPF